MKYTAIDINYDTDGENVDLPKEIEVNVPDDITDEIEILDFIGDKITDTTGFCHFGFSTNPTI